MKIIAVDNYNTEVISDRLIHEHLTQAEGKIFIDSLNSHDDQWFYRLVEDDHKLYEYKP